MRQMVAFQEQHVDEAAELLSLRHKRQRLVLPLLPSRFEDVAFAREEVTQAFRLPGASGVFAYEGAKALGYLIGAPRAESFWGANLWVELGGHAVEEPELIRDLYSIAAARWFEEGRTQHYVIAPATDAPLLDAWNRLCFGQQHAIGACHVPQSSEAVDGMIVRQATLSDLDHVATLAAILPAHQSQPPVFFQAALPTMEELKEEWSEGISAKDEVCFVAEKDGRLVGVLSVVPAHKSRMHRGLSLPEGACLLSFAVTSPTSRGLGAGIALTNAAFVWARENHYPTMVVDWRMTNLLSSRFWPRRGFQATFLRLYRSIP